MDRRIRRKNIVIQRAILKVLREKGPMTSATLAKEIRATYRTVKRHLHVLERYRGKVEVISYYPDIRLYGLRTKRLVARCQKCGAKVVVMR